MSLTTATAIINLAALKHNLEQIRLLAPKSKILAVLKANAYGHGLERIAKALAAENIGKGADAFGVARLDEALALRASGIVQPIVLLEGFFSAQDLPVLAVNNLQTIVHNEVQLKAILEAKLDKPLKVWLKIDTGMHRLGINPGEFSFYYQQLSQSENVQNDIILMSHLGCADDKSNSLTSLQIALFDEVTQDIKLEKTLANSAGICAWPQTHFDWVRPGLLLYGVSPMLANTLNIEKNFKPVMTLKSSLIAIRKINAHEAIGYGGAWMSQQKTTIGVVAIGYGDGYPRHAENGTPVLINGRMVSLIGRVSMDMITVDLGNNSKDAIGDEVTLWGDNLPVEQVAKHATTIPYELLCNITRRVQMTEV